MALMTPLQKRAERRARNQTGLDMNLVSLIDVFTILIFFLLSNATGVELLPSPKAVQLPQSTAEKEPKQNVVLVVSGTEIIVEGRKIANVADVMGLKGDLIGPLKDELDIQAGREMIREANKDKGKALTIMGDKDIPYQLLRKIMYTAARASFTDMSFAVRQKAGA
jgi:biopolymer transport protein ExbD